LIIVNYRPGQLGNRLFYAAHLIACSVETDAYVVNLGFHDYSRYFRGTCNNALGIMPPSRGIRMPETLMKTIAQFSEYLERGFQRKYLRLPDRLVTNIVHRDADVCLRDPLYRKRLTSSAIVFMQGWIDSDRTGLAPYRHLIVQCFQPTQPYLNTVIEFLKQHQSPTVTLVGVHLRRGDYSKFAGGRYFYSNDEYKQLMRQVAPLSNEGTVRFVLCSNEKVDLSEFFEFDVVAGPGHMIEDLYVLSGCDLILGPPSTFSMWASFYGQTPYCMISDPQEHISIDSFKILTTRG
jgi:hypothetical protein